MKQTRLLWIVIYSITALIFGWALFNRIRAANYQPATPASAPLNKFDFQAPAKEYQLSRYEALLAGGLFFEKISMATVPVIQSEFHSRLVVYGLVKGKGGRAIVGLEGDSSQETWIVRPGSVVENETIVGIGNDYIEVRNGSGTGKVFLRK